MLSEFAEESELIICVPRQHNPEFIEQGGVFSVELRASSDISAEGWSASVNNDLRSWAGTVISAEWGAIHFNTEEGWNLKVSVTCRYIS